MSIDKAQILKSGLVMVCMICVVRNDDDMLGIFKYIPIY